MRTPWRRLSSERGSVVVMIAVSLFAMLALAALAIDLASVRDAKAEAQRSADVIALAGAAAFRDYPWTNTLTVDSAQKWAIDVARANKVRADTLDLRNETSQTATYAWGSVRVVRTNQVTLNPAGNTVTLVTGARGTYCAWMALNRRTPERRDV